MTAFVLFFCGLSIAMAWAVGRLLWRLRKPAGQADLLASKYLMSCCSALESYRPLCRVLAQEDFIFLAAQPRSRPDLLRRLRRKRREVLHLYLKQLRADFRDVHRICRVLSAKSRDPAFAALVSQQAMKFYGRLLVVHACCFLGWPFFAQMDVIGLVASLDRLREAMRAALVVMAPQPHQG